MLRHFSFSRFGHFSRTFLICIIRERSLFTALNNDRSLNNAHSLKVLIWICMGFLQDVIPLFEYNFGLLLKKDFIWATKGGGGKVTNFSLKMGPKM